MPPVPTGGGVVGALETVAMPLGTALASVGDAMKKLFDATRAILPILDTLGSEFKSLGEKFKTLFRDNIGIPLADAVKAIGQGIKFALPTDVLDYFVAAGTKTGVALKASAEAFLALGAAAPVAAGAVAGIGLMMAQFVAKANPAVAEQFNLALNDVMAVIGQALMPVLQVATTILRAFGDSIASFSGMLGDALGEIAGAFIPIFEVLFDVFARVMQVVAEVLKFVAPLIRWVAEGIKTIFDWIGRAVRYVLSLIGIEIEESPVKKGASVGAAARSAQIGTVEDAIRKAQTAAFSLGTASGLNYAEMTATNTSKLLTSVGSLADIMTRVVNALQNPLKVFWDIAEIRGVNAAVKKGEEDAAWQAEEKRKHQAIRALSELALSPLGTASPYYGAKPHFAARAKEGDGSGCVKAEIP